METIIAIKKLIAFLKTATLIPKYFFSTGNVRMPTIISVVVNAEITIYETPFCLRIPLKGNAINPGIMLIEPKSNAIKAPTYLLPFDKYFEMSHFIEAIQWNYKKYAIKKML